MTTLIRFVVALTLSLFWLSASAATAQDKPGLSLFTFSGERNVTCSEYDPLMLFVSIENAAAQIVRRHNQRSQQQLDQFTKTDEYKAFSNEERAALAKDYAILDVPKITLGSASVSLESLINFQVKDTNGQSIDLGIRPLASNEHKAVSIELPENQTLLYLFAATADQLKPFSGGVYQLVVILDTTKENDMWQGEAYSNTISVTLAASHPDPSWQGSDQQAMLTSAYLIGDQRYNEAEAHARDWVEQHPSSIDAWGQLGEALLGQNQETEALDAFNTAITKFRIKNGNTPVELPDELLDRINQIEQE